MAVRHITTHTGYTRTHTQRKNIDEYEVCITYFEHETFDIYPTFYDIFHAATCADGVFSK